MTQAEILVVEDDPIIARLIEIRLQRLGYAVLGTVSSGEAAISMVNAQRPDLVLMDIKLQGEMDGITAAEMIISKYRVPLIYLTSFADESLLERAKKTEPQGYILKPFEDDDLRTTIEIVLYRNQKIAEGQPGIR